MGKAYFALIELLMRNHAPMIVELETPVLQHICRSLREGLQSHDVAISSQCAASLEHLAAFHFRLFTDESREVSAKAQLQDHLVREPTLFSAQLASLLHMVVFEECANQASEPALRACVHPVSRSQHLSPHAVVPLTPSARSDPDERVVLPRMERQHCRATGW